MSCANCHDPSPKIEEEMVVAEEKEKQVGEGEGEGEGEGRSMIFTYGTLKLGFSNHGLLQELIRTGDAIFLGNYRTALNYPLVCGPYRVPFLLNLPGSGQRVLGELYAVSAAALARLDELEGTTRAHYQRLPIQLQALDKDHTSHTHAQAYFAHTTYATNLWNKNAHKGLTAYTHEVARGYVKRSERPHHLTFLDHINSFLSSPLPPLE